MFCFGKLIRSFVHVLFLLTAGAIISPAQAQSTSYVTVTLPQNVSISLPRNWVVISGNQRTTLDASVVARLANAGVVADFTSDLQFAANYYDDGGRTAGIFNVRYYPTQTVTQADSRNASSADVQELDAVLNQEIRTSLSPSGLSLLAWMGTSKLTINGLVTFVTEYRRSSPNGSFRVKLVRVLDSERSFTVTISYREDQAYFLQPISDYVTRSLRR